VVGALSLIIVAALAFTLLRRSRPQRFVLAAGSSTGESYIIGDALKKVVEQHYPRIRITLLETGGTVENLQMIEDGRAQLAAAQADVLPGPRARLLAVLYDDRFQLLVSKRSGIQDFADLRGKRVALSREGGQFQSFLSVADHFDLRQADFHFVGATDKEADSAFLSGQADALFRVRSLGDPSIQQLITSSKALLLPIDQAAAMKIKNPAYESAVIPQGTYSGNPPVPDRDIPTVAIHRFLLARDDANPTAMRAITQVLMDRRQEIMSEIPRNMSEVRLLLAQVHEPSPRQGLSPALQRGAASFYNRDKPSFLLEHADYVGLIVTLMVMAGSWVWELRRWMQKKQKNTADLYSDRAVALMNAAKETNSVQVLEDIWSRLLGVLTEAVQDLDADKLSEESFNSFRSILQVAMDATRDRRAILASSPSPSGVIPFQSSSRRVRSLEE
jgi:TRAP transporter TAXI family solute receptor